jgi:hypothetical protein
MVSYIGADYRGLIDQVMLYDYDRTQAQISWDYNRGAPAGWWKLDECSGNQVYDASGNAHPGTITIGGSGSNTSLGTCSSDTGTEAWNNGTNGYRNASLDFDGTDDHVSMGDVGAFDTIISDGRDFSLAGWFNRDTFTADHTIVGKRATQATGNNGFLVWIDDSTDKLVFEACDNSGASCDEYQLESATTFTATGWHHFVVVWDDDSETNTTIYIDGVAENVTRTGVLANIGTLDNPREFRIGRQHDGNNPFDGQLDEIMFFSYALNAHQVKDVMNSGAVNFGY